MDLIRVFSEASPTLMKGLATTLQVTCLSLVLALVIGVFACLFGISKMKPLQWIAKIYIWLIRGTPMLVQAFYIFFALPVLLKMILGTDVRIDVFTASLITLTLNAGAYMSEIFRGAIESVNKGQMEAARSLGLPYGVAMRKIILPQAIRIVIPSVLNQFIITLKDTTILSVIGCGELMRQGQLIVARNYQSFQTYAIVAVMYYVVVIVLTKAFQLVERRLSNK